MPTLSRFALNAAIVVNRSINVAASATPVDEQGLDVGKVEDRPPSLAVDLTTRDAAKARSDAALEAWLARTLAG